MAFLKSIVIYAAALVVEKAMASPISNAIAEINTQIIEPRKAAPLDINLAVGAGLGIDVPTLPSIPDAKDLLTELPDLTILIATGEDGTPTQASIESVVAQQMIPMSTASADVVAAAAAAGPFPPFPNITSTNNNNMTKRQTNPLNIKLPALPNLPALPALGGGGCPTTNNQSNQCSTGIPYCCSPDGDGGSVCEDGQVSCDQTVVCCNNFNGMQFCMGDMDFNIPITINLNMGKKNGGKGKKNKKGKGE